MSSLIRTGPVSSTRLLMQILHRPDLVAAVRELPAPLLGRLIDRVGLEDAGEIVALASSEQLQDLFDQDLWQASSAGEDESFRPERFALWLETLFEGGEDFLIESLCALPRDLLTLAVHRLVRVVDMDGLWERFTVPSAAFERLERALDAPLHEEWGEFRLLARDPSHWDVVWSALVALDRDHSSLLRTILEECCALSSDFIAAHGGEFTDLLTSEEMLEVDVAGDREDRRAGQGFVPAADARAFLSLARSGRDLEERDGITKAYFRALTSETSTGLASGKRDDNAGERGEEGAVVRALVRLIEESVVKAPSSTSSPAREIADGSDTDDPQRSSTLGAGVSLSALTKDVSRFRAAMTALQNRSPERFAERSEELHYLANVLIAGGTDRRRRPAEALEEAVEVCNQGLEIALGADIALASAVDLLEGTPADELFRRGYCVVADGSVSSATPAELARMRSR